MQGEQTPHCPNCDYDLSGAVAPRCSECGYEVSAAEWADRAHLGLAPPWERRRRIGWFRAFFGNALLAAFRETDDHGRGTPVGGPREGAGAAFGPFIGVASLSKEKSLRVFNGRQRYDQWLFVVGQPRVIGKDANIRLPPGVRRDNPQPRR